MSRFVAATEAIESNQSSIKRTFVRPVRILDKARPSIKHIARHRALNGTIFERAHKLIFNRGDESSYFEPKTLGFWRNMLIYLFLFSMVGHAMEVPYCKLMGLFGIVKSDYAAVVDPWYVPYWVYGIGAVALSITMVPLKIRILKNRKTLWGACLEFFLCAVVMCAFLETVMGLLINQPNSVGEYPFWDNSKLPLNILGQGWLVNDIFLGLVSVFFVWVLFPLCQKIMKHIGDQWAKRVFYAVAICCAVCCFMAYAWPPIAKLFGI